MNQVVSSYLVAAILGGCVAAIVGILIGVDKGIKAAGWPDRDRKRALGILATLLIAWFFAALIPASLGFYNGRSSGIPTIQYGVGIPLFLGVVLFWRWQLFRRAVEALPLQWMAGIQVYRLEGLIFLVLYAAGKLPGEFAWPAGCGDIAVGLLAPMVAVAYARNPQAAAGWLRAWNLLGIADLVVALGTGFLSSPSPLQMLAFDKPNVLISAFPLVIIPVFLVPLSILLHLASLKRLSQATLSASGGLTREPLGDGAR